MKAGYQAAGTVTGAAGCPDREPLTVLAEKEAVLWPDADEAGRKHMQAVAAMLGEPGEIVGHPLRWIEWGSDGADAADALKGGVDVGALIAGAGPVPPAIRASASSRMLPMNGDSPISRFLAEVTVSDALRTRWGVEQAAPGRSVRCPAHDDRSPSLSIARDDLRAWCHAPSCQFYGPNGRGVDAWDLWQGAR